MVLHGIPSEASVGCSGWVTQRMMRSEDLPQKMVPKQEERVAVPLGLGRTQGPARRRVLEGPGRSH